MSTLVLQTENISLVRGERLLFKQLSFSLSVGKLLHLHGRNGSGKTSLFKVLTGMLSPTSGQVRLFGETIKTWQLEDNKQLLYIGHQAAIKRELTVLENITLNAKIYDGFNPSEAQLIRALDAVGLTAFSHQRAGKLSAGQQRRILLSRLWLCDAENSKTLWLLDEPFTALDVDGVAQLQIRLTNHVESGGAVILASHQALNLPVTIQMLQIGEAT